MNKQEAIEKLRQQSSQAYDQRAVILEKAIDIVNQIDVPEQPVIPQFVADWIEKTKRTYNLYGAMGHMFINKNI